jgi:hypothetical protein
MDGTHAIGVDVGGTKILAGIVSREGEVLRQYESMTPLASQDAFLDGLASAVTAVGEDGVAAVGFGLPAPIDQRSGRVAQAVNIPLADVELRRLLCERIGLPVGLANDAQAAAIGEWRAGAGRGASDLVMLTLGTGVGGGLILDGKPYRGANGVGGELGHVQRPAVVGVACAREDGRRNAETLEHGKRRADVREGVVEGDVQQTAAVVEGVRGAYGPEPPSEEALQLALESGRSQRQRMVPAVRNRVVADDERAKSHRARAIARRAACTAAAAAGAGSESRKYAWATPRLGRAIEAAAANRPRRRWLNRCRRSPSSQR